VVDAHTQSTEKKGGLRLCRVLYLSQNLTTPKNRVCESDIRVLVETYDAAQWKFGSGLFSSRLKPIVYYLIRYFFLHFHGSNVHPPLVLIRLQIEIHNLIFYLQNY